MTRVLVAGGGIVGLATAYSLRRHAVTILEKEAEPALHQTGRNSGVLHSGIYYKPGSAKALNCRRGKEMMQKFCQEHGIDYQLCGKVIVATREDELAKLQDLFERGTQNGVDCSRIDRARLRELEPHAEGLAAIHVPEAGIIDYRLVSRRLLELSGATFAAQAEVLSVQNRGQEVVVGTPRGEFVGDWLLNCSGLQCDRVTRLSGQDPGLRICPFKGEYYALKPEAESLCRGLIYPVPDPSFPFLGVHLTRMIYGGVECGPNAVLAFGREAYGKLDLNFRDLLETLTYPGFLRLAGSYWKTGMGEMWRSISKPAFVKAVRRLCPELRQEDLVACPPGIRAQAIRRDGSLEDDFRIVRSGRVINVLNAPSPAATSSLAIGEHIAGLLQD